MSHLTEAEYLALQSARLHRRTPYVITNVSRGQFSVARHYGGITFSDESYVYIPATDELVRADVVRWLAKWRMAEAKAAYKAARDAALGAQLEL